MRHTYPGIDPTRAAAQPRPGRWHARGEIAAIYLAATPDTAWAEWYRFVAAAGGSTSVGLPRALWTIGVDLDEVADLSAPEALASVGLDPPRPTASEWLRFQAVGERLRKAGVRGVLAPSAARAGGLTLTVFTKPGDIAAGLTPRGAPTLLTEPPPVPRGGRT